MAKKPNFSETFLKHEYDKIESRFTLYDNYTPNFYRAIVAGKFYARHDQLDLSLAKIELVDAILKAKAKTPREKFPWPVTESQRFYMHRLYGWYEPLVKLNRQDPRFYFPITMSPNIRQEIKIRNDNSMKKEKFTGIPFKL